MTTQEAQEIILSWCGPLGPTSATLEEIEDHRFAIQGRSVSNHNENDLIVLLSLYVSPPKLTYGAEITEDFNDFVREWIETWVLLAPNETVQIMKKLIKENRSWWIPLLNLAQYLGQVEGRFWVSEIVSTAREKCSLTVDIDRMTSRAFAEILKHESQEWHDEAKEFDRQVRSGIRT